MARVAQREKQRDRLPVAALVIGPRNAEAAVGFPWRWCRDTALELGVPFVGHGRKRGIMAADFIAALRRESATPRDPQAPEATLPDPAAEVRRLLAGMRGGRAA
jgi:hypothetical protein